MAQPIQDVHRTESEDSSEQALRDIAAALAAHKDAVIAGLGLLQALHDAGVLEVAAGLLAAGDDVLAVILAQLNGQGAQKIIQNMVQLAKGLSGIDPEQLELALSSVTAGLQAALAQPDRASRLGVVDLWQAFRDPDVNASLALWLGFLQGMGKGIRGVRP
ncbi:MAG: helical membrane plugin domain-containing protein [Bacilli bacterium]